MVKKWKLKVAEGVISIMLGETVRDLGEQLYAQGDHVNGAILALIGWALILLNLFVFADGVAEYRLEKRGS